jgi:peptide/nickel transport system substrate-binding protein
MNINNSILVSIPASGGELSEGVVGSPRFINPLLAATDVDRDLASLVFAGLMRADAEGKLVPALAERYSVSEDGTAYQFVIREDAEFHDGVPVTADDVVFTIERAQDPAYKSPKLVNWEGVNVEKISDREVQFTLLEPYAPFLENATMGILPKHIWQNARPDEFPYSNFNIEPIGAGPYQVHSIERDETGIPMLYRFRPFKKYALGEPHISSLVIRFYRNEAERLDAYVRQEIGAMGGVAPDMIEALDTSGSSVRNVPLPRVFAVFFNVSRAQVLARKEVRQALSEAVDKEALVTEVLHGFGSPLYGPVPPELRVADAEIQKFSGFSSTTTAVASEHGIAAAIKTLEDAGWERNEDGIWERETDESTERLAFTISTADTPELVAAARKVTAAWNEMGAAVSLNTHTLAELQQNIIRPRQYEALLFGEVVGRELDLYAFWHSSQRNDPGLNIAMYANIATDELLEDARAATDPEKRQELYSQFENEVREDVPAVFLYAPDYVYLLPAGIESAAFSSITSPNERFATIHEWYIETERIWPFLKDIIEKVSHYY